MTEYTEVSALLKGLCSAKGVSGAENEAAAVAAEMLENFMKTALSTYSSPRPLPIFAAASYEYCKRSLAKNPKTPPEKDPAVRKQFLESDLQYHKVIGEFFDEDNFNDEEFRELAKFLFSDIAQITPGEL